MAAPVRGEVQPWVWLLRAMCNRGSIESIGISLAYLVSPHIP